MPATRQVSLEELASMFSLPEKVCARQLGVCLTSLKKICRSHGISRWPYRKLKSIDKKLGKIESALNSNAEDPSAMIVKWEMLKMEKKNLPYIATNGNAAAANLSSIMNGSSSSAYHHHHLSASAVTSSSSRAGRKVTNRAAIAAAAAAAAASSDDSDCDTRRRTSPVANAGALVCSSSALSSPASPLSIHLHNTTKKSSSSSSTASGALTPSSADVLDNSHILNSNHKRGRSSADASFPVPSMGKLARASKDHSASSSTASISSTGSAATLPKAHSSNNMMGMGCAPSSVAAPPPHRSASSLSLDDEEDEDDDDVLSAASGTSPASTPRSSTGEPPRAASRHRPSELDLLDPLVAASAGAPHTTSEDVVGSHPHLHHLQRHDDDSLLGHHHHHSGAVSAVRTSREDASLLADYYCRPDSARFSARGLQGGLLETLPLVSPCATGRGETVMDELFPPSYAEPLSSARGDFFASEEPDFFLLH